MNSDLENIVIGIVANLEARKGHYVLFEALAIIMSKDPALQKRLKVWIIGEGPLFPTLHKQSTDLGLQNIIEFLGYRYDYLELISEMDIMVLPSVSNEDSPLCTIEAMSLGIPSVVSDFAGLRTQIINDINGYRFPVGDKNALASAVSKLIYNDELRISMGKASLERYKSNYTPDRFVQKYIDLYNH